MIYLQRKFISLSAIKFLMIDLALGMSVEGDFEGFYGKRVYSDF